MSIALHGWHRLHATGHQLHGHHLAAWGAAIAAIVVIAGLLAFRGLVDHDHPGVPAARMRQTPVVSTQALSLLALDLARAEARLAAEPGPMNALAVARSAWQLACVLPPGEAELHDLLLDRAAALLCARAVIDQLTKDDRRMKALIEIIRRDVVDLPAVPASQGLRIGRARGEGHFRFHCCRCRIRFGAGRHRPING